MDVTDKVISERREVTRVRGADSRAFSRLRQSTVTADAIDQIKRLIAAGILVPGQRLPSERALADLLGVSRPTMREIMSALEAMGIVTSRHGSGTYITSLSSEVLARPLTFVIDVNRGILRDLFEVRILLEAGAAQAAASRIDDETLARLATCLDDMRSATDADSLLTPDLAFHQLIHRASGNRLILALMESLRALTRQSLEASASAESARRAAVIEHQAILDALRQRNGEAAAAAMRKHVENARDRAEAADQAQSSQP